MQKSKFENKKKQFFDEYKINQDIRNILETASLLNMSEFDVFMHAYQNQFHKNIDEITMEKKWFINYMFKDEIPPWVNQFTREIVENAEYYIKLDKKKAQQKYVMSQAHAKKTMRHISAVIIFMTALIIFGNETGKTYPQYETCMLPPCYEQNQQQKLLGP